MQICPLGLQKAGCGLRWACETIANTVLKGHSETTVNNGLIGTSEMVQPRSLKWSSLDV